MTINTVALRQKLQHKVDQAKERKTSQLSLDNTGCDHEWKKYRQNIQIDWEASAIKGETRSYCGPPAPYFIVKACAKCKTKRYLDMKSL